MKISALIIIVFLSACHSSINYPTGGYNYPSTISNVDTEFYKYPLKDSLTRRDSVYAATDYLLYQAFNEPNLSIKPMGKDIFRLTYSSWQEPYVIVVLTENEIVVKKGFPEGMVFYDTTKLSIEENKDLQFMDNSFYSYTITQNPRLRAFYDSMFSINPKLFDSQYYVYLRKKIYTPLEKPYTYSINRIGINRDKFLEIVDAINKSGYWKLPHKVDCETYATDSGGFALEANTTNKYNYVSTYVCPDSNIAFVNACKRLIAAAGLQKDIRLVFSKREMIVDSVKAK
jgi:hypothetical protein